MNLKDNFYVISATARKKAKYDAAKRMIELDMEYSDIQKITGYSMDYIKNVVAIDYYESLKELRIIADHMKDLNYSKNDIFRITKLTI